jgi:hypothetical protein
MCFVVGLAAWVVLQITPAGIQCGACVGVGVLLDMCACVSMCLCACVRVVNRGQVVLVPAPVPSWW